MVNYQRPAFINKSEGFSILYFRASGNFLIINGALEEFFLDSMNLEKIDYNITVDNLISKHAEFKDCFIDPKHVIIDNNDDYDFSSSQALLSSQLRLSNQLIEIRFDLQSTKDIFLSAYEHLKTLKKFTIANNILSIVNDKNKLYLFSESKILSIGLKKEYYKLQAQFANKLIEYYHDSESNQWLCSFHACAVKKNNKTYLILGDSGAGKSTLTALLCASGYRFIGDDLILMDKEFNIYDNPAAISVKENSWNIVSKYHKEIYTISESNRKKGNIKMKYLPLHLIQNNTPKKHKISALIWVNYTSKLKTQLKPLSSFDVCSKLIPDTWVNPDLNYPELFAHWLISSKGFQLRYSDFSSLKNIFDRYL
jgi:hypothetical protein